MSPSTGDFLVVIVAVSTLFSATSIESAHRELARCDHEYRADKTRRGVFQSPDYPESYPNGVTCRFRFIGGAIDRVQLRFTHFSLRYHHDDADNPYKCDDVDLVVVSYNGTPKPFAKYCGSKVPPVMMSTDNLAEVLFFSLPALSTSPSYWIPDSVGFSAQFAFVSDFGVQGGEQREPGVCEFVVRNERSRSGTITSPNYPGLYPRNIDCQYVFRGSTDQQVTINFTRFDVEGLASDCLESTQSDYVEFRDVETWLLHDGTRHRHRRLCSTPTGRQSLHSVRLVVNSASFTMTFHSNDVYDGKGFTANYQFHQRRGDIRSDKKTRTTVGGSSPRTCTRTSLAAVTLSASLAISYLLARCHHVNNS